jgi:hypothetical protein
VSRNNDAPNAIDDFVTAIPGRGIRIDVIANDSDPDIGDSITAHRFIGLFPPLGHPNADPSQGTLSTGNFVYTPFSTATGTDSFLYYVKDRSGATDIGQVIITIVDDDGTPIDPLIEATPVVPVIEETLFPGEGPVTRSDDVRIASSTADILDIDKFGLLGGLNINLTNATDQIISFNGSTTSGVSRGFENVDASGYTGFFGSQITGTTNANTIKATGNGDVIVGNSGNDIITGGGGNDIISGGNGTDTAVFTGSKDQYSVRESGKTVILTDSQSGRDGSDTLVTIENYEFSDGTFQLTDLINPVDVDRGIYRFLNVDTGTHFFSGSSFERDSIINNIDQFNFEGPTFRAADSNNEAAASVFRFFNTDSGTHFFTQSTAERDAVFNNLPNFIFEGEAYKGYTEEVEGSVPLYRFLNTQTGTHFYTAAEAEKININDTLPSFNFEGIAYYVDPYIDSGGL